MARISRKLLCLATEYGSQKATFPERNRVRFTFAHYNTARAAQFAHVAVQRGLVTLADFKETKTTFSVICDVE